MNTLKDLVDLLNHSSLKFNLKFHHWKTLATTNDRQMPVNT